jgi:predicted transcriptional regulator
MLIVHIVTKLSKLYMLERENNLPNIIFALLQASQQETKRKTRIMWACNAPGPVSQ